MATPIETANDFFGMSGVQDDFILMNDIDVGYSTGGGIEMVGNLDGQGYTVSNFLLEGSAFTPSVTMMLSGVFAYISGKVENLNIENVRILTAEVAGFGIDPSTPVGWFAGAVMAGGEVINCSIKNAKDTDEDQIGTNFGRTDNTFHGVVGGFVAFNHGTISNCFVEDSGFEGFIAPSHAGFVVINSSEESDSGVGFASGEGIISNCYSQFMMGAEIGGGGGGQQSGSFYYAGFVSEFMSGTIEYCYAVTDWEGPDYFSPNEDTYPFGSGDPATECFYDEWLILDQPPPGEIGIGLSTTNLQSETFIPNNYNWDSNIWEFSPSNEYPFFAEPVPEIGKILLRVTGTFQERPVFLKTGGEFKSVTKVIFIS